MYIQIQEALWIVIMMNSKKFKLRRIIIKLSKTEIFESSKRMTYKRAPIKPSVDFSEETLQARKEWDHKKQSTKRKKLPIKKI